MNRRQELVFGLARRLQSTLPFHRLVDTDAAAVRLFVAVAHDGACPGCGSRGWRPHGDRWLRCTRCGLVPAYRRSAFAGRRVAVRDFLAAVHALLVDSRSHSSRAFARERELRRDTAWRLLDAIRATLPVLAPSEPGLHRQLLGREADANRADVVVAYSCFVPTVVGAEEGGVVGGFRRQVPLLWGHLRAWMTAVFRGVSAAHLWKYLAEFGARQGRVRRAGGLHV